MRWPHHNWRETHHGWMFSSQLNQVFAQVSGTILIAPERVASITGFTSVAASTYHWSVSHGSITTPERSPYGVAMVRSSTLTSAPSASSSSTTRLRASKRSRPSSSSGMPPLWTSRAAGIEHVEHLAGLEAGALADLKIVEVVPRRDLDRARAQLGIGMLVGDDRDQRGR